MADAAAQPVLSIVVPMYNAQATIVRTIDSLKRIDPHHDGEVELIVVDDGSTDAGTTLARQAAGPLEPLQPRFIEQPNAGSAAARNRGLELARGQWVYFLDADDELLVDPLPLLNQQRGATALIWSRRLVKFGQARGVVRAPRLTRHNHLDRLTAASPIIPSGIVIRRDAIDRPFDPTFEAGEDWYFWLVNPRIFDDAAVRPDIVGVAIHAHGGNKSSNYVRRGCFRERIAQRALDELGPTLSTRQRNNLHLQRRIGILQNRREWSWRDLFRLPCSTTLWLKLLVYGALRGNIGRIDFYGK